jgi:hypothetical protein
MSAITQLYIRYNPECSNCGKEVFRVGGRFYIELIVWLAANSGTACGRQARPLLSNR